MGHHRRRMASIRCVQLCSRWNKNPLQFPRHIMKICQNRLIGRTSIVNYIKLIYKPASIRLIQINYIYLNHDSPRRKACKAAIAVYLLSRAYIIAVLPTISDHAISTISFFSFRRLVIIMTMLELLRYLGSLIFALVGLWYLTSAFTKSTGSEGIASGLLALLMLICAAALFPKTKCIIR